MFEYLLTASGRSFFSGYCYEEALGAPFGVFVARQRTV